MSFAPTNASPGQVADGQQFNGAGQYMSSTTSSLKTPDSFTLSLWLKANDTVAPQHLLWQGGPGGAAPWAAGTFNGWGQALTSGLPLEPEMNVSIGDILPATSGITPNYLSFFLGDTDAGTNGTDDVISVRAPFSDTTSWHYLSVVVSSMSTAPQPPQIRLRRATSPANRQS